jgi:hypothetical protein
MKSVFPCVAFLFLISTKTVAQPKGIHLSWNGNKKVNTSNTMAVTWMNDKAGNVLVVYGTDSLH